MKRYSAIMVFDYEADELVGVVTPNNGVHWKELLQTHPEFETDNLEWLSNDYDTAIKQLHDNDYKVSIVHYDRINPLTKRRQVDNGKSR